MAFNMSAAVPALSITKAAFFGFLIPTTHLARAWSVALPVGSPIDADISPAETVIWLARGSHCIPPYMLALCLGTSNSRALNVGWELPQDCKAFLEEGFCSILFTRAMPGCVPHAMAGRSFNRGSPCTASACARPPVRESLAATLLRESFPCAFAGHKSSIRRSPLQ